MAFPNQRLTRQEKIKQHGSVLKWAASVADSIDSMASFGVNASEAYEMQSNYDLVEGRFNKDDFKSLWQRYGAGDYKMPVDLAHYDIMSPKYELLKGEHIKRPFNWKVIQTNPEVVTMLEEKQSQLIFESFEQIVLQDMQRRGLVPPEIDAYTGEPMEQEAPKTPQQIQEYINYTHREIGETLGHQALEYLSQDLDIQDKFNDGWGHYLKSGKAIFWVGNVMNEPVMRVVDPRFCDYDMAQGSKYVEDASWFREWRFITASDVYDEFYEDLSDEDVKKIESLKGNGKYNHLNTQMTHHVIYDMEDRGFGTNTFRNGSDTIVRVMRLEWKALRKIGVLTYYDADGEAQEKIVDESHKVDKTLGESVKWYWVNERWEITKIGEDIYVKARPVPGQKISLDNKSKCKLGYVGIVAPYSLVAKMKPYQLLYNVLMYHLRLEFATAMGQIGIFDVAQIPRDQGFDINKWLYYARTMKIGFINSLQEGKNGKTPVFNQFKVLDLSLSNSINHYVTMLDKIEEKLGNIAGVTKQREGQTAASETLGGVERSVNQSNYITEYLFEDFNQVKKRSLSRLLDEAKIAWRDGKKGQYVMPDMSRVYFNIDGNLFSNCYYGIFVSNAARDHEALNTLKGLANQALAAGSATLVDIAEMLTTSNTTQLKKKLQKAQDAAHQRQIELQDRQTQGLLEVEKKKMDLEKFKQDNENARNSENNQTKITVAEIGSFARQEDQDGDDNGVPDQLELEKVRQAERKMVADHNLQVLGLKLQKEKQTQEAIDAKEDRKLKEKEIAVKKIAAKKKPSSSSKK